jgi:hypothetical protein
LSADDIRIHVDHKKITELLLLLLKIADVLLQLKFAGYGHRNHSFLLNYGSSYLLAQQKMFRFDVIIYLDLGGIAGVVRR